MGYVDLHFNDAVVVADIKHLTAELMSQTSDGVEMLVLVSQSLTGRQVARVEIRTVVKGSGDLLLLALLSLALWGRARDALLRSRNLTVVLKQLLEDFRAQNADLGQEQFALNQSGVGVVEHSPDGDEIVQLTAGLFYNAIQALKNDGHTREVLHLRVADNQTVNVESSGGQNSRDTGEHTRLILNQTVQDVTLGRVRRRKRSLVQDGRHSGGSIPLR